MKMLVFVPLTLNVVLAIVKRILVNQFASYLKIKEVIKKDVNVVMIQNVPHNETAPYFKTILPSNVTLSNNLTEYKLLLPDI
jgi:hypothetical protein